jgi:hypothetical protein
MSALSGEHASQLIMYKLHGGLSLLLSLTSYCYESPDRVAIIFSEEPGTPSCSWRVLSDRLRLPLASETSFSQPLFLLHGSTEGAERNA